ncbi:MAG: hypothetical protein WD056_00620 [Gemmatimonadota bacterium]
MPVPSLRSLGLTLLILALPLVAQAQDVAAPPDSSVTSVQLPAPADTYGDASVRALLERARTARTEVAAGLETYEAQMHERVYFGVSGELFRRERGIFDQERVSRIRWSRDGNHVVRWEGARVDIPIAGLSSQGDSAAGLGAFLVESLSGRDPDDVDGEDDDPALPPPLAYDAGSDRLSFGADWALNPLADSAVHHYRFESGDTLTISLPGTDRRVVLAEVRVVPRRSEFRLVSASLWFDLETAGLVRAGYRPARPFDLELDGPDDGDSPPGFLRPIRAEIRYVTVDHGLYDLEFWIPRRFAFEGEARVAAFARFPITIEWTVGDVAPNARTALIPDEIPEGWILREAEIEREGEEARTVTVLVPTAAELASSPELTPSRAPAGSAFNRSELAELEATLERLAPPGVFPRIRLAYGTQEGLTRYNRVEGFSAGVAAYVPLPARLELRAEARYGFADREPGGELRLLRGPENRREELAVFRRLDSSTEWARPEGLAASLSAALWGSDYTPFHRSWGAEAVVKRSSRPASAALRLFAERHDAVQRETHAHLSRLWNDHDFPENPTADEGSWVGAAFDFRWQAGSDPRGLRGFGALRMEAAGGASEYGRGWLSAGLTVPLFRRWSGAVEGGFGTSVGDLPGQRQFYPGGPALFRGSHAGQISGESFWFGRAEAGPGLPLFRLVGFVDALAVGPRDAFWDLDPAVAVGAGFSLLDGMFRVDLSRNVRGTDSWQVFLYLDGLF